MKKDFFISMLLAVSFLSCSENELVETAAYENVKTSNVVYPLTMLKSRNADSFENNWENHTSVMLNSEDSINLPWVTPVVSTLPFSVAYDIKKEDGWIMLAHTFQPNSVNENQLLNYIILYNQRNGLLKIFYYVEPQNNWSNNTAFWCFNMNVPHKLFNHVNEVALPMDINLLNHCISSNLSQLPNKAYSNGWNGTQIQLAYDTSNDNTNSMISIIPYNLNTTSGNFSTLLTGVSDGQLITQGSTNPLTSLIGDVATVFGNEAKEYIEQKYGSSNAANSRSLIGGIGGALVETGVNKILTTLTAGFSQPTTTVTDLSFTTRTEGKITGTLTENSNAPGSSLTDNFSTSKLGINLGVWNLASAPTIYIDPLADRTSDYFNGREYNYRFRGITGYNYDLRINPDLEPYLIKHWVDIDVVRYINKEDSLLLNPVANFDYGTLGHPNYGILFSGNRPLTYIYQGDANGKNKIVEEDMRAIVYAREGLYDKYGYSPTTISVPNEAMYLAGDLKYPMKDTYLKFNLFLVTEFEGKRDTTLHTRTFVPKVEWDPVLYNQYGNYSQHEILPKLEIMEENDSTLLTK